jgi:hypothetical protein
LDPGFVGADAARDALRHVCSTLAPLVAVDLLAG